LKPHLRKCRVIPPEQNAEYVADTEDIPDVYRLPYDPEIPTVCTDGQPVRLIGETGNPIPAGPGKPEREDYEYERNGTAAIFMFAEPPGGKRYVSVRERRTAKDRAQEVRDLPENHYPDADHIRPVCDNPNTHKTASFCEVFPPEEAGKLINRLGIHHTPEHGSRLNIAEIGLSVLTGQCLGRRIPDMETLRCETGLWEQKRNGIQKGVNRQFRTGDVRIKLRRLYPQIQS